MKAPPPPFPAPPPPPGGYGCPRCGSPHTTEAEVDGRFLLLSLFNQTTCNACGFTFDAQTGKSTTGRTIAWIAVPLGVVFGLGWLVYWLVSYQR
jgi:hypothetical protein